MKNGEQYYLTESPIRSALIRLALPIMASSFFSTAYNLTDMIWIGKLGSTALAGVGAGGMFLWFSSGFSNLARMGGQVHTAQSIGRKQMRRAREYSWGAVLLAALLGLLLGSICILFPGGLIRLLRIREEETIRLGMRYLRITGGMVMIPFLNNTLTGLYTARGNSRLPLIANTAGLACNMLLDPLLVLGPGIIPRMEVTGAALATVIAQCISLSVFVIHMIWLEGRGSEKIEENQRKSDIDAEVDAALLWPPMRPDREALGGILRIGFPAGMQTCAYCFFSMILTTLCAGYGSGAVAVQRLGGQIESITWNAADGFGTALNAFTGQNYGAGKHDRIRKGFWFATAVCAAWGGLFTLIFLLLPEQISRLFFYEPEVIAICVSYLVIVGLSEPFMSAEITAGAALCGLGKTAIFSAASIVLTGCRIPLAFYLTRRGYGLEGVWWALTLTSMAKGFFMTTVFLLVCRKNRIHSSQPSVRR